MKEGFFKGMVDKLMGSQEFFKEEVERMRAVVADSKKQVDAAKREAEAANAEKAAAEENLVCHSFIFCVRIMGY